MALWHESDELLGGCRGVVAQANVCSGQLDLYFFLNLHVSDAVNLNLSQLCNGLTDGADYDWATLQLFSFDFRPSSPWLPFCFVVVEPSL